MPSESRPADLHIASLVRLACEDLRAANALYEIENRGTAYHLGQAVEKLILAVLISEDIGHEVRGRDMRREADARAACVQETPSQRVRADTSFPR